MGTNVYVYRKPYEVPDFWSQLYKCAVNQDVRMLVDVLKSMPFDLKIHIGKRSAGWKFVFNHNDWKFYDYTRDSIDAFLQSCDLIVDEYNNIITIDQFWSEFVDNHSGGFDGKSYVDWECDRSKRDVDSPFRFCDYYEVFKSRNFGETWKYFETDIPKDLPYRFNNSTDFS